MPDTFSALIEFFGISIFRIYTLYRDCPAQPVIQVTPNTFRLVLPNMNAAQGEKEAKRSSAAKPHETVTPQMKSVLDYLAKNGEMSEEALLSLLSIKKTRAYQIAKRMSELGLIEIDGRGAEKRYRLK